MTDQYVPNEQLGPGAAEALGGLRAQIAARPWQESAELVIADILSVASACSARQLPLIEVKQFCAAFSIAIATLLELMDRPQNEELRRLIIGMQTLALALQQRAADQSVQSKYAEARVTSRRALCENHDPVLDGFPKLVELSRKVCSQEASAYMFDEVQLGPDEFLGMLEMLASDHADCATVANPPARIRCALTRQEARQEMLNRQRWQQATPEQMDSLEGPRDVASEVMADVDWERAKQDLTLPRDESRAIEARMDGLNLQAADAPDELGWDATRLGAVRRSMEADRRWGRRLRKRLSAYCPASNSKNRT